MVDAVITPLEILANGIFFKYLISVNRYLILKYRMIANQ